MVTLFGRKLNESPIGERDFNGVIWRFGMILNETFLKGN
jgi:hypothetical protein